MTDIEERLRETLARNAESAPRPGHLLHQVHVQSRRRQRRYRAGIVGIAGGMALVTAAAGVVVAGYGEPAERGRNDPAAVAPSGVLSNQVRLVPASSYAATFPLTPRKRLPALGSPVVMLLGGNPTLEYAQGAGGAAMSVTVTREKPVDVSVSRQVKADLWVGIRATGPIGDAALREYASNLDSQPMAPAEPFVFTQAPAGFTVDNVMPSAVTFAPPGTPAGDVFTGKIAVLLGATAEDGQTDQIQTTDEGRMLRRDLGQGRTLTVQVPASLAMTDADLIQFAGGIRPTAAAAVGHG